MKTFQIFRLTSNANWKQIKYLSIHNNKNTKKQIFFNFKSFNFLERENGIFVVDNVLNIIDLKTHQPISYLILFENCNSKHKEIKIASDVSTIESTVINKL